MTSLFGSDFQYAFRPERTVIYCLQVYEKNTGLTYSVNTLCVSVHSESKRQPFPWRRVMHAASTISGHTGRGIFARTISFASAVFFALAVFFVLSATPASAGESRQGGFSAPGTGQTGGFTGPGPETVSVADALRLGDDARVTLKGRIIRKIDRERYIFSDGTGEITVEIDDDTWRGQQVGPDDMVILHGEIDREWSNVELDVDHVIKQ